MNKGPGTARHTKRGIIPFIRMSNLQVMENSGAADASAVTNPQGWVQSWARLVSVISTNALSAPRVVLSPLGNPDALGVKRVFPSCA